MFWHLLLTSDMSSKSGNFKRVFVAFAMVILDASIAANDCSKSDIYAHPTDCGKFFSCAPYGPVLMRCPSGLHFNPEVLACDWPQNSGCSSEEIHAETKCPIYQHPTDCTQFYSCSPRGHVLMDCPAGLHFNARLMVCDWPENARCNNYQTTITSENYVDIHQEATEPGSTTSPPEPESEAIIAEGTVTFTSIIIDDKATTGNSDEHSLNTDEFTIDGEAFWFNLSTQTSSDDYESSTPTTITPIVHYETSTTTTDNKDFTFITTTTDLPLEGSAETSTFHSLEATAYTFNEPDESKECLHNFLHPHPNDCAKFYMASPAGNLELSCPGEMLFNSVILACDWASNVECNNAAATTMEVTTSLASDTPSLSNYNETVTLQEALSSKPLCESNVWPHPTDCAKFFECGATGPVEKRCPDDLLFNAAISVCDWPKNVTCSTRKGGASRGVQGVRPQLAPVPNEVCSSNARAYFLIPDPGQCRSFLICDHGITYKSNCPEKFLFNKALGACVAFEGSDKVECMT